MDNYTTIFDWLKHPLLLVIVAGIFSSYIIPKVSKQWRKPKELELKITLISSMGESVASLLAAAYVDQVTQLTNDVDLKEAQKKWETEKEVIEAQIHLLFPKSTLIVDWQEFALAISAFGSMNEEADPEKRHFYVKSILEVIKKRISANDVEALILRPRQEPGKTQYADAWIRLKEDLKAQMNILIDWIRKSKISSL